MQYNTPALPRLLIKISTLQQIILFVTTKHCCYRLLAYLTVGLGGEGGY